MQMQMQMQTQTQKQMQMQVLRKMQTQVQKKMQMQKHRQQQVEQSCGYPTCQVVFSMKQQKHMLKAFVQHGAITSKLFTAI